MRGITFFAGVLLLIGEINVSTAQDICEPLRYYDPDSTTVAFVQNMPTPLWAVKMTPRGIARVDSALIGFGMKKNSSNSEYDSIYIYILEDNASFSVVDKDSIIIWPPIDTKEFVDDLYIITLNFQTPPAFLMPAREFWLAYQFRGPSVDVIRTLFKTPAANEARSVVINPDKSTTIASQVVKSQIPTPVDLYAETHVCYPFGYPVELKTISARMEKDVAVLEWSTATETNNYGFEIYRKVSQSSSGKVDLWYRIGFVPGHGTTTEEQFYRYRDPNARYYADESDKVYYQLRQIDIDGSVTSLPQVELAVGENAIKFTLDQAYPNPFGPGTLFATSNVSFHLPDAGPVTLKLVDVLGNLVRTVARENMEPGFHAYSIRSEGLATGRYFLVLETPFGIRTRVLQVIR